MKLSIGVIVVGALDWESKDYGPSFRWKLKPGDTERIERRTRWRNDRFVKNADEYRLRVPIRYGRKSSNRGNTFTMVFSPEFGTRLGTAKAIRCKRDVTSIAELTAEAMELWVAESNETHRGKVSASWGCVALLIHSNFLIGPDREERANLLASWAKRVAREKTYGQGRFSARDKEIAGGKVIVDGRLQIPWPMLVEGGPVPLDLLLATVTDPQIGASGKSDYPSPKNIAEGWNRAPHYAYYFLNNRLAGLETAEDADIGKFLNKGPLSQH
jgi:hypothetical protein